MKTLTQNIINIYGAPGETWITNLPSTVEKLAQHWHIDQIAPVSNMTFNYVAKAVLNANQPVILKISYEEEAVLNERQALMSLGSQGCIQLLDFNRTYNALLLEQANPGISLKSLYPAQTNYVMNCYIDTMQKLHDQQPSNQAKHQHIAAWLKSLDTPASKHIPTPILKKAIALRHKLLSSMGPLIFLHGDLHHDNILKQGNKWLAIDPKGIVGEAEFEIAAFDFLHVAELAITLDVKHLLDVRIKQLAQKSNLDAQRIKDWVFVRLVLMAAWLIEDHCDPTAPITLAERLMA